MSERMYQVIIGVLVLIILVGGAFIIGGKRASINAAMGSESSTTAMVDGTSNTQMDNTAAVSAATDAAKSTAAPGTPAPIPTVSAAGDAVSAADQAAGNKVTVEAVTVSKPTWVAVRRSNDWTIGVQLLQPGTHDNVSVNLVRPTVAGEKYSVVLMEDNGDGTFNLHQESLVMNSDGSPVSIAFLAK